MTELERFATSFFGGTLSVCITMPIDRLMPILQAANAAPNKTIRDIVREKMAREGVFTLQRGFIIRTIHCGWHTSFAVFLAGKIYGIFGEEKGGGH